MKSEIKIKRKGGKNREKERERMGGKRERNIKIKRKINQIPKEKWIKAKKNGERGN